MGKINAVLKLWPLAAACASAAMLAAAHAFETFGHLAPCTLCLYQRDVYWAALAVGLTGFVLGYVRVAWLSRGADALLALIFLGGCVLAAYHCGAEWKWWPGPTTCTGGGAVASQAINAFLQGTRVAPPRCDEAAWRMFGLSMAGYNVLISLALVLLSAKAAVLSEDRRD